MMLWPNMFPRNTNFEASYQPGALVMFENDGAPQIGVILGYKKNRYSILSFRGREVQLQAARLHPLPGTISPKLETTQAKTAFLLELYTASEKRAKELNMEELWSFVYEEEREYDSTELCKLYLGQDTVENHLTVRLALINDPIFFKRVKDTFIPRPKETAEQLKKAEQVKLDKLKLQDTAIQFFAKRLKEPTLPIPDALWPLIENLEEMAAGAPHVETNRQREAKDFVELAAQKLNLELSGSREQRAYELLQKISHFGPLTNLALIRHRILQVFSEAALKEANTLDLTGALTQPRLDLTKIKTITIDDSSTKDMDDALSLEQTPGGYCLGIHISDVASAVAIDSELDIQARRRATSIYCPDITINMFPEALSDKKLSLVAGEIRPCLSCLVSLDQKLKIKNFELKHTLIKVSKRHSYDEVDLLLESGEDQSLNIMHEIATNHETERLERGALKIVKREIMVVVRDSGEFELVEIDEHGPARGLVGEMMVLANGLIAEHAVKNKIPIFFRSQEGPDEESTQAAKIPAGPAGDYAVRATLKKSIVSLRPLPHATLALSAYTQVTSPIRRYADLCNQRQLSAHLNGAPLPYKGQELERIAYELEEPLSAAVSVAREAKRFWLLRYLERLQKRNETLKATVLRTDHKNPLIELDQIFMPTTLKVSAPVKPGDELTLKVVHVDPRYDVMRLEVV